LFNATNAFSRPFDASSLMDKRASVKSIWTLSAPPSRQRRMSFFGLADEILDERFSRVSGDADCG